MLKHASILTHKRSAKKEHRSNKINATKMLVLNLDPFPQLTTERLTLRPLKIEDAKEIMFLRTDDRVNKFLDRPKASSIDDAINFIRKIENGTKNNESFYWAITLHGSNTLIGTICLFNIEIQTDIAEIGYELNPAHQGIGIMQEAISEVIKFGLNSVKLKTITAFPNVENNKSIKLLERNNFMLDTNFVYANKEELGNFTCYFLKPYNH